MNKKGQTLIAFVLLIPIFLIFLAFVVDTGLILKENTKLNSTTKTILKNTYKEPVEEKIKELYKKNDIPTENLTIEIESNNIRVTNEYEIDSIFGNIIGLKKYKIKLKIRATIQNDEVKIEKE